MGTAMVHIYCPFVLSLATSNPSVSALSLTRAVKAYWTWKLSATWFNNVSEPTLDMCIMSTKMYLWIRKTCASTAIYTCCSPPLWSTFRRAAMARTEAVHMRWWEMMTDCWQQTNSAIVLPEANPTVYEKHQMTSQHYQPYWWWTQPLVLLHPQQVASLLCRVKMQWCTYMASWAKMSCFG